MKIQHICIVKRKKQIKIGAFKMKAPVFILTSINLARMSPVGVKVCKLVILSKQLNVMI